MFREPEHWENDSDVSLSSGSSGSITNAQAPSGASPNHHRRAGTGSSGSHSSRSNGGALDSPSARHLYQDANYDYGGFTQSNGYSDDNGSLTSFENGSMGTYTVEEAINHLGFGKFQWFIIVVASVVWVSAAIALMLTSALLIFIEDIWDLSDLQETCLASVPFVGEMFGAYLISTLSDRHGRKKSVLLAVLLLAFFLTISGLSTSFSMMVLCRLGAGFAVGGSLTALSLFTEFIPKEHRGEMTFMEVSLWTVGAILAVAVGWGCWAFGISWRMYLLICSIPCWLAVIPTILCPESPRFLLANGDYDKLEKLLAQISYFNGVSLNSGPLRGKQLAYDENHLSLPGERGQLKQMFYPKYRFTSYLCLAIAFPCVACYFGVALFQTSWLETMSGSTNAVFWETLVCTCGEIPGVVVVALIFDKVGRIPVLVVAFFVATLAFGGLIFAGLDVGLVLIFLARMCVCAGYNVLFVYILEYYPTAIRATALGFTITEARIAGVLASYLAEGTSDALAASVFCLGALVATICSSLLPTETLNKELSDDIDFEESHMIDYGFGNEYDYETHEYLAQKIFDDLQATHDSKKKDGHGSAIEESGQHSHSKSKSKGSAHSQYGGTIVDDDEYESKSNSGDTGNATEVQDAIGDGLYLPNNDPLLA